MRYSRALPVLLAALLVPLLALTAGAPTGAAGATVAVDKPRHVIRDLQAGQTRTEGVYFVRGRLVTAKGHFVHLQRRTRAHPEWRIVDSVRARYDTGRFRMTFSGPCRSEWRLLVRETRRYARTTWYLGRIVC